MMTQNTRTIREALIGDVKSISGLSRELGYPAPEGQTQARLETMIRSRSHVVYVGCDRAGEVRAWIHAHECLTLQSGAFGEISGFVVSKALRGQGMGKQLLKAVERWAGQRGLPKLRVRTQVHRRDAQAFYRGRGFEVSKEQYVFDKFLGRGR